MPSQITISRTSPNDVQLRQIILSLDDVPLATLMYGQHIARALEPGKHVLSADNTFQRKTIEFNLEAGEQAQFNVINRVGRFSWFLILTLGVGPMYVTLERA